MNAELTKTINNYYCNVVKAASPGRGELTEDENIYCLAFWGLLKCGYPFSVEEPDEDGEKNKASGKEADSKEAEEEKCRTIRIMVDDTLYTCGENELSTRFGKDFVAAILDEQDRKTPKIDDSDSDFILPFAHFDNPEEKKKDVEKTETAKETPAVKENKIPYIKSDSNYKDDAPDKKEYDSFLFNSHDIMVVFEDGRKVRFTSIVYPVYMDMRDSLATDIFCVVTDEKGRCRCGMSEISTASQKGVNVEFDGLTLVIRGEWRGGDFLTNCKILSVANGVQAALKEKVTHIRPSNRTSSFYLRHRGQDGTYLDVFPLSLLRNDSTTGLAQSVLMVEDGNSRKIYAVDGNTHYTVAFDGSQKIIEVFWAGNSLHLSLEDQ